jgi:hypothetical protein
MAFCALTAASSKSVPFVSTAVSSANVANKVSSVVGMSLV